LGEDFGAAGDEVEDILLQAGIVAEITVDEAAQRRADERVAPRGVTTIVTKGYLVVEEDVPPPPKTPTRGVHPRPYATVSQLCWAGTHAA
jgi:hypothetical protein